MSFLICKSQNDLFFKQLFYIQEFSSVDPNGCIFTTSPFFDPNNSIRPYFKKKASTMSTYEDTEESNKWLKRVQVIDISTLLATNRILFDKIAKETIDIYNSKKITPYPSTMYSLKEVNKAIKFIYEKKSLSHVFIDLKRKQNK